MLGQIMNLKIENIAKKIIKKINPNLKIKLIRKG